MILDVDRFATEKVDTLTALRHPLIRATMKEVVMKRTRIYQNLEGKTFGRWTIVKRVASSLNGKSQYQCVCSCGVKKIVKSCMLLLGKSKSCGCLARERLLNLEGKIFGRWTVLKKTANQHSHTAYICRCICGKIKKVIANNLMRGKTTSCGCLHNELISARSKTHGMSKSSEYRTWFGMIVRCHKKYSSSRKWYGDRGIVVCDRWKYSFEKFFSDMGLKPTPQHQIDRIDNNGNYEPSNCRWTTRLVNMRNSPHTKLTTSEVSAIKCKLSNGFKVNDIAKEYHIHDSVIRKIGNGKLWKDI